MYYLIIILPKVMWYKQHGQRKKTKQNMKQEVMSMTAHLQTLMTCVHYKS